MWQWLPHFDASIKYSTLAIKNAYILSRAIANQKNCTSICVCVCVSQACANRQTNKWHKFKIASFFCYSFVCLLFVIEMVSPHEIICDENVKNNIITKTICRTKRQKQCEKNVMNKNWWLVSCGDKQWHTKSNIDKGGRNRCRCRFQSFMILYAIHYVGW